MPWEVYAKRGRALRAAQRKHGERMGMKSTPKWGPLGLLKDSQSTYQLWQHWKTCQNLPYDYRWFLEGYLFLFFFFAAGFCFFWVPGSMLSSDFLLFCFFAFLLLCFFAFLLFLLLCFSAFCLPSFSAFPASLLFCFLLFLLLCFSASLFSLLLCFCNSVPLHFYYSTFFFLQSCVFAALLPAPLLLSFLSLLFLCFSFSFALFCSVCVLNETLNSNPKWDPKWNPKWNPTWNRKKNLNETLKKL